MFLVILGIALASFGILSGIFHAVWKQLTDQVEFKGKQKLYAAIMIVLFLLSLAIGSESYRLINHGKDKDEPLKAYLAYSLDFQRFPAYTVRDSRVMNAFVYYQDMRPSFDIVLCNPNDLEVIIDSIDIVIDEKETDVTLPVYEINWANMGDDEYSVFYGKVNPKNEKTRLFYSGEGCSDYFDPSESENKTKKYAKMDANSECKIVPFSPFAEPGVYTIHYVINYSLNGQSRQLSLPRETFYLAEYNYNVYSFLTDTDFYYTVGLSFQDVFPPAEENNMPLIKEKLDKLEKVPSLYEEYYRNNVQEICDIDYASLYPKSE